MIFVSHLSGNGSLALTYVCSSIKHYLFDYMHKVF
jgi:hypothetical protein